MLIIAMFLAWAIGGEYRFGKGKRGLLLAIPLTIYGIGIIPWWALVAQVGFLYCIYQALFYDLGIGMVYDNHDKRGWFIIAFNGALIGLTGVWSVTGIIPGVVIGILGFIGVVRLANDAWALPWRKWLTKVGPQFLPYTDDQGHPGYYINFKDAWWVSEGLMGLILGTALMLWGGGR